MWSKLILKNKVSFWSLANVFWAHLCKFIYVFGDNWLVLMGWVTYIFWHFILTFLLKKQNGELKNKMTLTFIHFRSVGKGQTNIFCFRHNGKWKFLQTYPVYKLSVSCADNMWSRDKQKSSQNILQNVSQLDYVYFIHHVSLISCTQQNS